MLKARGQDQNNDRRRAGRARVKKCGGTFSQDTLLSKFGLSHSFPFQVVDCSTTGMKMASYRPLDWSQRLVFRFPGANGAEMKVAGSVVWTEQLRDGAAMAGTGAWLGGVRFDELDPKVESRFERHIDGYRENAVTLRKPRVVRYYQKGNN
ncbi:MAG: PilZ domain-containing protein [Planctomycetes bacterium]|nr:PilZ domain-containing protein [Planctomycetota bacterium]